MCTKTSTPPTIACFLADLKPGQQFHDPNGETWMVIRVPDLWQDTLPVVDPEEDVLVVNIGNGATNPYGLRNDELKGTITPMRYDLKLGYDHKGRLYTSTLLNEWNLYPGDLPETAPAIDADEAKNQADKQYPTTRDDGGPEVPGSDYYLPANEQPDNIGFDQNGEEV